jgi:seryl-tRNA synthetase
MEKEKQLLAKAAQDVLDEEARKKQALQSQEEQRVQYERLTAHSAALSKARTSAEEEKAGLTKEIEALQSQIEGWKGKVADAQQSASSSSSESAARIKELEAELKKEEEAKAAMGTKAKEIAALKKTEANRLKDEHSKTVSRSGAVSFFPRVYPHPSPHHFDTFPFTDIKG